MTLQLLIDFLLKLLLIAITAGVSVIAWFLKDIFNQHRALHETVHQHQEQTRSNIERALSDARNAGQRADQVQRDLTASKEALANEIASSRTRLDRYDQQHLELQRTMASILAYQQQQNEIIARIDTKLDSLADIRERIAKLEARSS